MGRNQFRSVPLVDDLVHFGLPNLPRSLAVIFREVPAVSGQQGVAASIGVEGLCIHVQNILRLHIAVAVRGSPLQLIGR